MKSNDTFKDYWTHWQWLYDFFKIEYFRYLIFWFSLVPVAASSLSELPEEVALSISNVPVILSLTLPFRWEFLWISSFFFVVAYIIYAARCPRLIKEYRHFSDYKDQHHSPRWITWLLADLIKKNPDDLPKLHDRLLTKNYIEKVNDIDVDTPGGVRVLKNQTLLEYCFETDYFRFGMPILENTDSGPTESGEATQIAEREIFWEIFARYSTSRKKSRVCIVSLLIIALAAFAISVISLIWGASPYVFIEFKEALSALSCLN